MKFQENDIELIDQYLNGELNDNQSNDLQAKLKEDPEFEKLMELQKEVISTIKTSAFEQDVQAYLDGTRETKSIRLNPSVITGIAASIVLIISVVFYFNQKDVNYYDQYFEPYPDLISQRAVTDNSYAMYHYGRGEFQEAVAAFEEMDAMSKDERFYAGIAYLSVGELDKAESNLSASLSTDWSSFAIWYLALRFLKSQDYERAIQHLSQIQPGEFKYEEAQKILGQIED